MTSPAPRSPSTGVDDKTTRPASHSPAAEGDHAEDPSVEGQDDGRLDEHDDDTLDGHPVETPELAATSSKPSPPPPPTSVAPSPSPPSSTPRLTVSDKGKGKAVERPTTSDFFTAASDLPASFAMKGKLDPRSTAFTPLRHLDTPAAPAVGQRDGLTHGAVVGHAVETDLFQRSSRPRHSFSSNTSTSISTPASQFSFTPNTPSSALTWTSSPFSSVYTPHSSTADLVGRPTFESPPAKPQATQEDFGRFLMIGNVPPYGSGEQLRQVIQSIAPYKAIIVKYLKSRGWVIIAFYDSRHALKVSEKLSASKIRFSSGELVELQCSSIAPETVRQIAGVGEESDHIWRASESTIKVDVNSPRGVLVDGMEKCLSTIGELRTFDVYDADGKSFGADYWDTRHAADAIRVLDGQPVDNGTLSVRYFSEDPFQSVPVSGLRQHSSIAYTLGSAAYATQVPNNPYASPPFDRNRLNSFNSNSLELSSTTTQSSLNTSFDRLSLQSEGFESPSRVWRMPSSSSEVEGLYPVHANLSALGRQMAEPAALQGMLNHIDMTARARQQRPSLGSHWTQPVDRQAIPPENRVYPERIAAGLDIRTTVMIKDVPNKLSRQELIGILNEVVPGEFDFVYLRFDFNNHCNVGYAFVNFTSCQALLTFIKARVGKKWNMFSSEKVLQVSYANIQGKAALVNKFRNSAVMDVIEEWRPQIFYSSGALKGKPEPFPEADNPAMRHRSTSARLSFLSDNERPDYDYSGSTPYNF